ncbi:hypothetical protein XENOCAPTIV_024878 [Xenoophorus captivus]|uniref:Uncharacterized protein n=1 Tax=Xenoophorus captivus TaxID=1517983 RepID=A0ABV0QBI1_9TELE
MFLRGNISRMTEFNQLLQTHETLCRKNRGLDHLEGFNWDHCGLCLELEAILSHNQNQVVIVRNRTTVWALQPSECKLTPEQPRNVIRSFSAVEPPADGLDQLTASCH